MKLRKKKGTTRESRFHCLLYFSWFKTFKLVLLLLLLLLLMWRVKCLSATFGAVTTAVVVVDDDDVCLPSNTRSDLFNSPIVSLLLPLYINTQLKTKLSSLLNSAVYIDVCLLLLLLLLLFTCHEIVKTWTSFLFTLTSLVCVCTAQQQRLM